MAVFSGRYRADIEGDFVVFVIGMRINRPWDVGRWGPVFLAMPRMVDEARSNPEIGLLAANLGLIGRCPTLIQYWRSFEHLDRYARDPDARHLPAWRRFNQTTRGNAAVGIFHETYKVRAGEYEAIYVDMPRHGLAAASGHHPVGSTSTAALRIGERQQDSAPVEA